VSIGVGLFTLFSMTKIWAAVFWGEPQERVSLPPVGEAALVRAPHLMNVATAGLVAVTIGVGIFVQPIWRLCQIAAQELMNPGATYIPAVLGR
jgi:multicomponent Na+:H+ antiporter subunit D